jgi:hypothetical protein
MGVKYYFKKDLLNKMGIFDVNQFKQTWICR